MMSIEAKRSKRSPVHLATTATVSEGSLSSKGGEGERSGAAGAVICFWRGQRLAISDALDDSSRMKRYSLKSP
jgi:hypothetical protein